MQSLLQLRSTVYQSYNNHLSEARILYSNQRLVAEMVMMNMSKTSNMKKKRGRLSSKCISLNQDLIQPELKEIRSLTSRTK